MDYRKIALYGLAGAAAIWFVWASRVNNTTVVNVGEEGGTEVQRSEQPAIINNQYYNVLQYQNPQNPELRVLADAYIPLFGFVATQVYQ